MTAALRAEVLKLRSLRITAGLLGIAAGYVLLNVIAILALQGVEGSPADVGTAEGLDLVLGLGSSAYLFSFVIGVMASTGEYRHGTAVATFLAEPRRARVVVAKVVAAGLAGVGYGAACLALALAVSLPWLGLIDHAPLGAGRVAAVAAGTVAAVALFAAIGAALGALVRNQVVALVSGLSWLLVGEGLLLAFLPEVGRWLPSGTLGSLTRTSPADEVLPPWAAALVLVAYAVALTAAAVAATRRRDV
ncbi:MAG: hypothetical protein U0237_03930 [Thermoleophilia bacterium]